MIMDSLLDICKQHGIKVIHTEEVPSLFHVYKKIIILNPLETEYLTPELVLAHELGHYMDMLQHFNGSVQKMRSERYTVEGAIAQENRAWDQAKRILSELGYTDWATFEEKRNIAVQSHMEAASTAKGMTIEEIKELEQDIWETIDEILEELSLV